MQTKGRLFSPDQIVTQYGRRDASGLRVPPRRAEPSISLIAGRLIAEEAHRLVVRRGGYNPAVDVVRYTTVGDLFDAGFEVRRRRLWRFPITFCEPRASLGRRRGGTVRRLLRPYTRGGAMTSQIAIEQGRPPWLPAADAEPVLPLHSYDMPLVGVIRQHGQLYLFRCIDGHVDEANLWTYTVLSPAEFAELEQVTSDSLDATVDSAAADRPAVLALADDDRGITLSTLIDHPEDFPTLLHAASASLGRPPRRSMDGSADRSPDGQFDHQTDRQTL